MELYSTHVLHSEAPDETKGEKLQRYLRATSHFLRDSSFSRSLNDDVARKWYKLDDAEIAANLVPAFDVIKQLAPFTNTQLYGDLLETASNMAEAEFDDPVSLSFVLTESLDHKDTTAADLLEELPLKSALHRMVAKMLIAKAEATPTDWWRLLDVFSRFCTTVGL